MLISHLYPLISCICITDNRPTFLLKAVIHFDAQNYPNRELVVSYPKTDLASKILISKIKQVSDLNIMVIEREECLSLGLARNEAVAKCNGEYICTWDDDDWHREVRLIYQYTSLLSIKQKREACILPQVVLFDSTKDRAWFSGTFNWAGTLLCKKEIVLQHPYSDTNSDEGAELIQYLITSKYLHYFANYNLYAFIYHGTNITDRQQFKLLTKDLVALDMGSKEWLSILINRKIDLVTN